MKKSLILLVLLLSFGLHINAQENTNRKQEIGVIFSGVDHFGVTYRIGKENALWRLQALTALQSNNSINLGAEIGREWRKTITEHLALRYGFDVLYQFSTQKRFDNNTATVKQISQNHVYGLGLIFGFNVQLSDYFLVGAEFKSRVFQDRLKANDNGVNHQFSKTGVGFNSSSAMISLIYNF